MDNTRFWSLIEQSWQGPDDCEAQAERLTALLETLAPEEICDFDRHFARRRVQAYRWDLWGVAYLINGGCSDDGFEYFRCWLIAQGQKAFAAALADPETVAELMQADEQILECEDVMYAADYAYENVTGTEMPHTDIEYPSEPAGVRWQEEDLERLYPALYERF